MATTNSILSRIARFVPTDKPATVTDLRQLYAADPDALFSLAVHGVGGNAPSHAKGFESMARTLSVLMRDGFSIETRAQQHYAEGNRGGLLALDAGTDDIRFMQELYGGATYPSKLHSHLRSKDCLDFYLDGHSWDDEVRGTKLLRVAPDDAEAILDGHPGHQYHALLDCAREVVRCPAVAYPGLRHEGPMQSGGWAFCGIPSRQRMNDGAFRDPPPGFTFVVFADPDGFVFDWDWVPSANDNPAIPRDAQERFQGPPAHDLRGELLLGNVAHETPRPFQPGRAWFSVRGDCVFWYLSDAESYAAREDEYLTVFYRLDGDKKQSVGFKLKMVSRLFETVKRWARGPREGILVDFNSDPVRVDLVFLMNAWIAANLPRSKELFPGMRLLERLGDAYRELQSNSPTLDIPRRALQEFQEV